MKKLFWFLGIVILISILGYFFIAFRGVEINEESPLIKDSMDTMDEATKAEFEAQVEEAKDLIIESSDLMPTSSGILAQGDFKERAHGVEGKALLIETDGEKILRFEDFETINGPNLHIYLSSELGNSDFVDLGKIKATKGNINYQIPEGVDIERYDKVLVWCVPFGVLFSYSELE